VLIKGDSVMSNQIFGYDINKSWDYENGFYLTSHPVRLAKAIAHWELYKKIQGISGDIVEVGTYKGASMVRFLTYREMCESQYSRKVISFDAFGKFPATERDEDNKFIKKFESEGGEGISKDELDQTLRMKNFQNYKLVEGNIFDSIEPYLDNHKNLKISLLHIDVDVYDATLFCLDKFYEKVTRGGVIIFDDYCAVEGATRAIDEYMCNNKIITPIEKLGFYSVPSFMVKE